MLPLMLDDTFAEPTRERQTLNAAIDLGARARAFFESALGRDIAQRAEVELLAALDLFVKCGQEGGGRGSVRHGLLPAPPSGKPNRRPHDPPHLP